MKAFSLTTDARTLAPRTLPATLEAEAISGVAVPSRNEAEDATEVLRDVAEDTGVDGVTAVGDEALAAETATVAASADELLRLLPQMDEDVGSVGSFTMKSSVGFAVFRIKPESESIDHF